MRLVPLALASLGVAAGPSVMAADDIAGPLDADALYAAFGRICMQNVGDVDGTVRESSALGFRAVLDPVLNDNERFAVFAQREMGMHAEVHADGRRWQCIVGAEIQRPAPIGDILAERLSASPEHMPPAHDNPAEGWVVRSHSGGIDVMAIDGCPADPDKTCAAFAAARASGQP